MAAAEPQSVASSRAQSPAQPIIVQGSDSSGNSPFDMVDRTMTPPPRGSFTDLGGSRSAGGPSRFSPPPTTSPERPRFGHGGNRFGQNFQGRPTPPPNRGAQDQDQTGLSEYVRRRAELLEVLSSLHATGVQKELDLPQIVVVGSQSVGKSSLIESMSGITLPRDSGTCTRCPMECRLQYDKNWSCKVVLRFHVDSENNPLSDIHEKTFGPTIYDRTEVAAVLRRAQRAILRPMLDPNLFLDDSDLTTPGFPPQSFSANTVCIRVAGPNVPDLYFYDLPGIIANVADEGNERDIRLVEELAVKYMSQVNCIILLVISCETDFENQGAGRLVLRNQNLRNRVVGVLTKVDRIEPGTSLRWVNILKNRDNQLKNGWFCVKQPSARELEAGISWEDARDNEDAFFRLHEPWASLNSMYRRRMGSIALSEHLSTLLSDLVSQKLPVIQKEISRLLRATEQDLAAIPAPNIRDPRREVITIIRDFRKIVSKHIQGLSPDSPDSPVGLPGLLHSINQLYDELKHDVHRTAPQFMPWERRSATEFSDAVLDDMVKEATLDDAEGTTGRIYHVDEVMDMAKRSRTRELPGNYPFIVTENIIRAVIDSWHSHAIRCFESVKEVVFTQISHLVGVYFSKYSHSGFLDEVNSVVLRTIEEHGVSTREKIESLCSLEALPFTQNEHYFLNYREKLRNRYKSLYRRSRGQEHLIENLKKCESAGVGADHSDEYQEFWRNVNQILTSLRAIGIQSRNASDLTLLLPKDEMDPAIDIMAEARAYFQVAYKRFADTVPQQIDSSFLRGFDSSLDIALMYMDLSTETCLEYLQEAPDTVRRRDELQAKKRRLERAREKLQSSGRM
ncbi:hypothetical protein FRC03_009191 [Tulasnella sp. 419]|nr:hypothetical protein FRC03_009191 [Tulasnella sp. 419]